MAESSAASVTHYGHPPDVTKRDMLKLVAGATAGIGVAAVGWSFVDDMNPAQDVLALSPVEVDLNPISAGQGITVLWQGKPIFVRQRTPPEIKQAADVQLNQLIAPQPVGQWGGWFCPCHGSQDDTAGRVHHGLAPANLAVPPYAFESATKIKIG